MIDLILQGTKANLATLLRARGLIDDADNPVSGVAMTWWGGDGKFMTAPGTYGPDGTEITPPTYLTGFVLMVRIHGDKFVADRIDGATGEQWARSRIAKWIKDNGTADTFGGLPCYTVNSVRLMRAQDVYSWCAANGVPRHEWFGGNSI